MADIGAVTGRAGVERFAVYGHSWSADIPFALAARHPDRVTHLAYWKTADPSNFLSDGDLPPDASQRQRWQRDARTLIEVNWELYIAVRSRITQGWDSPMAPSTAAVFLAAHSRESMRAAEAFLRISDPALRQRVAAPVLVVYPMDDQLARAEAPAFAASFPGARLLGVPADEQIHFGSSVAIQAVLDFVAQDVAAGAKPEVPTPNFSHIRTILFTDIQDHTAMMQRLGDAKGREVLREHERITREALKAHGGTEVKTIGDSFMASFSSAQKAVECAIALQHAFAQHSAGGVEPISVRIGLNAGEPIADEDDLFGSSVILAARTKEKAAGGEILVTEVVRHLVTGKGFVFADRGAIEMKGFEEPVRLYEVQWREEA
jgi:class 3 adenylate cyclase